MKRGNSQIDPRFKELKQEAILITKAQILKINQVELNEEFIRRCAKYFMGVPNLCELTKFLYLPKQEQDDILILQCLFTSEFIDDLKQEAKNELGITN